MCVCCAFFVSLLLFFVVVVVVVVFNQFYVNCFGRTMLYMCIEYHI